jgi:hypothetical protein
MLPVDELAAEKNIIDFEPYNVNKRMFLSILQKSPKSLKIYRIHSKDFRYEYVTKVQLE